jgi:hypothetical protein
MGGMVGGKDCGEEEMLCPDTLTPPAPATTGAFYFFNHPQAAQNGIQCLAPSPTSTADIEPLFTPK